MNNDEQIVSLLTEIRDLLKKPEKKKAARFVPPLEQEVQIYITEQNYNVGAAHFIDFYESKNWHVGKNKMKDWKACVRNWDRSTKANNNGTHQQAPKQSLGERATAARKEFEQQNDLETLGKTKPNIRS